MSVRVDQVRIAGSNFHLSMLGVDQDNHDIDLKSPLPRTIDDPFGCGFNRDARFIRSVASVVPTFQCQPRELLNAFWAILAGYWYLKTGNLYPALSGNCDFGNKDSSSVPVDDINRRDPIASSETYQNLWCCVSDSKICLPLGLGRLSAQGPNCDSRSANRHNRSGPTARGAQPIANTSGLRLTAPVSTDHRKIQQPNGEECADETRRDRESVFLEGPGVARIVHWRSLAAPRIDTSWGRAA